jgi:hypothetical protein
MTLRWNLLTLLCVLPTAVFGQDKPEMMFLGSTHLNNTNRNLANTQVDDVLVPGRQAEFEELVRRLARWKPTHIAVEWEHTDQAGLDTRYAAYRSGAYVLSANEIDQIGLRLAKVLNLPRVDAVDWSEDAPGNPSDYDYAAWAKLHGRSDRYDAYVAHWRDYAARETAFLKNHSVVEWYLRFNDPQRISEDGAGYFELTTFGDDHTNPGAAWVGQWYARNLRIFGNIRALAKDPSDRVLVVYGAGHGPYLRKDATESLVFHLVDPRVCLRGGRAH